MVSPHTNSPSDPHVSRSRAQDDPWPSRSQDRRTADSLVAQMRLEEKLALVTAHLGYGPAPAPEAIGSAAYCPGVPRLGIPPWDESDASLGVTNPRHVRGEQPQTAFASSLALAATFDLPLAREQGQALGRESRIAGMTVQLAGGVNLVREPRGGRNFEYFSEDALLTALMGGAAVAGIQSQGVISTLKHFAVNPQETGRVMMSSDLPVPEMRESDLLAFELAMEHGGPRAIMTGYNQLNGLYVSEHPWLLNTVLKGDWGFSGFVMSDWGGTHSTVHAALAGLDRESGGQLDTQPFFEEPLADAVRDGRVPESRVDDMAARIVTALLSVGTTEQRRESARLPDDVAAENLEVASRIAADSLVLLRNENEALPLPVDLERLVVLGASADVGVIAGGGSSAVQPPGTVVSKGFEMAQMELPKVHHRPAPLAELRRALPTTDVVHLQGSPDEIEREMGADDTVVVFAERWATEGRDRDDLALDDDADALIAAAARSAARVIVVLETPGAVLMPWIDDVDAVVEAWYPGSAGAAAIAAVLTGSTDPVGRLPVTFPRAVDDLPRPQMIDPATTTSNPGAPRVGDFPRVDYGIEGADVGYRWYEREGIEPLFWFGFGLGYSRVEYSDVEVGRDEDGHPQVELTVRNTGERSTVGVPQLYLAPPQGTHRLAGWARVELGPGEQRRVRIVADEPRLYARYQVDDPGWRLTGGDYGVRLATSASPADVVHEETMSLEAARLT